MILDTPSCQNSIFPPRNVLLTKTREILAFAFRAETVGLVQRILQVRLPLLDSRERKREAAKGDGRKNLNDTKRTRNALHSPLVPRMTTREEKERGVEKRAAREVDTCLSPPENFTPEIERERTRFRVRDSENCGRRRREKLHEA